MAKTTAMAALALAVVGCGAPASNSASAQPATIPGTAASEGPPVPEQVPPTAATGNEATRSIRFSDGSTVSLQASKIDAKQGVSDARCAVAIDDQRIDTVGSGDLDAYTCGALVDAGPLAPLAGARRIGLIYSVSSPNAQFQTALILVEQNGRWAIDADTAGQYDDTPEAASIAALAKATGGEPAR